MQQAEDRRRARLRHRRRLDRQSPRAVVRITRQRRAAPARERNGERRQRRHGHCAARYESDQRLVARAPPDEPVNQRARQRREDDYGEQVVGHKQVMSDE